MGTMLGIKLVCGLFTGIGAYIGKKYVGPRLISLYKKAKTALLARTVYKNK